MTSLPLKNIREDNPRDFLAALGILRLIDLVWPDHGATLAWPGSTPELRFTQTLAQDWSEILTTSLQELSEDPSNPLFHGEVIKADGSTYRDALRNSQHFAKNSDSPLRHLPSQLYAAYSSQLTEEKSNNILPTAFSFSNGQSQKLLLRDVSQLISGLAPEEIGSTIYGSAKPRDAKSLRWHPAEYRAAAYRSHDPGANITGDKQLDYPALNVLAFIGLTFFPCSPHGKNGATAGITRSGKKRVFRWPIWSAPLRPDTVSLLLNSDDLLSGDSGKCQAQGIDRAWESTRFSSDKSLYFSSAAAYFQRKKTT